MPAEPADAESSEEKSTSKRQILVVEDNVVNQKVALGQLRNLGYDEATVDGIIAANMRVQCVALASR